MTWKNDADKRRRDAEVYGSAEYRRNSAVVRRRANGRCEQCGKRTSRIEVDHIVAVSATGVPDHSLPNLAGLCPPCHSVKTAHDSHAARRSARPAPRPRTQW